MNRAVFSLPAAADYTTARGLEVSRRVTSFSGGQKLDALIDLLDRRRGVVLSSGTTVPGRYESFDLGFANPPLRLESVGEKFFIEALNERGKVLIAFLAATLNNPAVAITSKNAERIEGHIVRGDAPVEEEKRTRRASIMSLVREIIGSMSYAGEPLLGLFGAFAYDLVFQIEDLKQKRKRDADQRDIESTRGKDRETPDSVYTKTKREGFADHAPGVYQATVERAREAFARGDLFAAVPGQLFAGPCERTPADVFKRLCIINPSPYGALLTLGAGEYLVSASPEMFVRSDGKRVETCPISGTIA